ncbi:Dynein beta chain, ciliary, partial [Pseudolycoriella hygida]
IVQESTKVELELIKSEIEAIDLSLEEGINNLTWNSDNVATQSDLAPDGTMPSSSILDYLMKIRKPVETLQDRMNRTQTNLAEIRKVISCWVKIPLFERKDSKKDAVLCIDERFERITKRYADIREASKIVHRLLYENLKLFGMESNQESKIWQDYVLFVDNIVYENILLTVGVSLGYVAEQMDPSNNYAPLFESRLELLEPDLIF